MTEDQIHYLEDFIVKVVERERLDHSGSFGTEHNYRRFSAHDAVVTARLNLHAAFIAKEPNI